MIDNSPIIKFQSILMPVVIYSVIILSVLLAVLFLAYLISIMIKYRQEKYISGKKDFWITLIKEYSQNSKEHIDKELIKDKKYLKDTIIEMALEAERPGKYKKIYKELGFYTGELKDLKSKLWWEKVAAIEHLDILGFKEAKNDILPLLHHPKSEVRFSAIKVLASLGSEKLLGNIYDIFKNNSRWNYRYLINILYKVKIPSRYLRPLAESDNRDMRKAAAVLLNRSNDEEKTDVLVKLADDPVKDIRRETVGALGRDGSARAIEKLKEMIEDDESQVRALVAHVCKYIPDPEITKLLERLADDDNFDVRYQAFRSLLEKGKEGLEIMLKFKTKYPNIVEEFYHD